MARSRSTTSAARWSTSAIAETQAALVIVDPFVAYLGAKVDIHRANETRAVLARLARVAEERKVAIVLVRHLTKGGRDKAIYRGLGSIDITAACRSVLLVGADAADRNKRALVHVKSNLAPQGDPIGTCSTAVSFAGPACPTFTAERILAAETTEDGTAVSEATEFVREALQKRPLAGGSVQPTGAAVGHRTSNAAARKGASGREVPAASRGAAHPRLDSGAT